MKESKFQINIKQLQIKLGTNSKWKLILHLMDYYLKNYCNNGVHEFILYMKGERLLPELMTWFSKNYDKCKDICENNTNNSISNIIKNIDKEMLPIQQALFNKWKINEFYKLRTKIESKPFPLFSTKLLCNFLKENELYKKENTEKIKMLLGLQKHKNTGLWRKNEN